MAETEIEMADLQVAGNDDIPLALNYYRDAQSKLMYLGNEALAHEVAKKISALETVLFTAYYPRAVVPVKKYGLIVYAHLPELAGHVTIDAQKFAGELGGSVPLPRCSRIGVKLEPNTPLTIIPESTAVEFDPVELTKTWDTSWLRFPFDFKIGRAAIGDVVVVRVSIQIAGIEIASVNNCAIELVGSEATKLSGGESSNQKSFLYQRIFVSYSRRDQEIARRYKLAQSALGNEAFMDVDNLRSGENWRDGLAKAIDEANVFQLFWSKNSAASQYCNYE